MHYSLIIVISAILLMTQPACKKQNEPVSEVKGGPGSGPGMVQPPVQLDFTTDPSVVQLNQNLFAGLDRSRISNNTLEILSRYFYMSDAAAGYASVSGIVCMDQYNISTADGKAVYVETLKMKSTIPYRQGLLAETRGLSHDESTAVFHHEGYIDKQTLKLVQTRHALCKDYVDSAARSAPAVVLRNLQRAIDQIVRQEARRRPFLPSE